jgi:hypothetical protein
MPGLPNAGYSPPVHMIRLTETREIAPYSSGRWTLAVHLCTEILIPTGHDDRNWLDESKVTH